MEPPAQPPEDPAFNPDETRIVRPRPGGRRPTPSATPIPTPAPSPDTTPDTTLHTTPEAAPDPTPDETRILRRPTISPPAPAPAPAPAPTSPAAPPATPPPSMLPMAMPLLQLLGRLRTLAGEADPAALRDRTEAELRAFETRTLAAGFPPDQVRRAQYAIADSLDDAVLNTPWGAASPWAAAGMVASLHPTIGPGRFLDTLRQAETTPALRPVLEVLVLCLSLGRPGPHRTDPAHAEALRQHAAAALGAQSPPLAPTLSDAWHGVDAPYRPRRARLPLWVAATIAVTGAAGLYLWLGARTNAAGDALFTALLEAPPNQMPAITRDPVAPPLPPPAPPEPTIQDRLRTRLPGLDIAGTPANPTIRVPEATLFPPNSATLLPTAAASLAAIADALRPEPGRLLVAGYSDDRPVHTVAFPSAFKLSAARAEAVRAALTHTLATPTPPSITAEGRAAADPIASNATQPGRDANRRIEITLDPAPPPPAATR